MERYVPDIYQKSIHTINYDSLLSRGIKCLLFDLDNTIAPIDAKLPSKEVKILFKELKEKGFKVVIFSNSPKVRVKPFSDELQVESCSNAKKPSSKKFLSVIKILGYNFSEVAIVGDSMIDDISGGNVVGITTILVNRLSKREFPFAWLKRKYERRIVKKLRNKDLFTRGRYYE